MQASAAAAEAATAVGAANDAEQLQRAYAALCKRHKALEIDLAVLQVENEKLRAAKPATTLTTAAGASDATGEASPEAAGGAAASGGGDEALWQRCGQLEAQCERLRADYEAAGGVRAALEASFVALQARRLQANHNHPDYVVFICWPASICCLICLPDSLDGTSLLLPLPRSCALTC